MALSYDSIAAPIKGNNKGALEKLRLALEFASKNANLPEGLLNFRSVEIPNDAEQRHDMIVTANAVSTDDNEFITCVVVLREETASLLAPLRHRAEFGEEIEVKRTTIDIMNHPVVMPLIIRAVSEMTRIGLDSIADIERLNLVTIPAGSVVDVEEDGRPVDKLSTNLLMRVLMASLPENTIETIRPNASNTEFRVNVSVSAGGADESATGVVVRSDVHTAISEVQKTASRGTAFNREQRDSLGGSSKDVISTSGYYDIRYLAPEGDLASMTDAFGGGLRFDRNNPLPKTFASSFILTDIGGRDGRIPNLETAMFSVVCSVLANYKDPNRKNVISSFETYLLSLLEDTNPRYIGALGLADPVFISVMNSRDPNFSPAIIDFPTDNDARTYIMQSFDMEDQAFFIDVARGQGSTHFYDVVMDTAERNENGMPTDRAIVANLQLHKACNQITGGEWLKAVQAAGKEPTDIEFFSPTEMLIPMGYYIKDGVKHDLRNMDYLSFVKVLAEKDPEAIEEIMSVYERATQSMETDNIYTSRELERIISEYNGGIEVNVTGYGIRFLINDAVIEQLRIILMQGPKALEITKPEQRAEAVRTRGGNIRGTGAIGGGLMGRNRDGFGSNRQRPSGPTLRF